ncbi:MAG TPA: alkene reductase [Cyclobacteriaceae bacterium]|nr:alkene reductase [Cyclobacteriaceae bacterium]
MKAENGKDLFGAVSRHGQVFSNAIAMAPMTRCRAIDTLPNEIMMAYYAQRSTAGLIITEGNSPSINGLGYARTPGIYSDEQIEGWRKITHAVHDKGGKIVTQLMHVGRIAHSSNKPAGARTLAPSAVRADGDMWTDSLGMQKQAIPEEMTLNDISDTINEFVQAAKNAIEAGFDGIELHGANGYLPEQFLNPTTNQRSDIYGGSTENRARFVIQLTEAVVSAIGKEKVGIRLSPYNQFNDMKVYEDTFKTYSYLTHELSRLDILYLHVIDFGARATEEGRQLLQSFRQNFINLLILNGGYTKERAEHALQKEGADMISFGAPFIANPDLPYRMKNNIPLQNPDANTFYTPGEQGYADYAFAGRAEETVEK